jgi:nitrate/nitrite transporter NarK
MSRAHAITRWDPEDTDFWQADGRRTARRNMWTSVFAEHVGFCVWSLWSVLVLFMAPKSGFGLSTAAFLLCACVSGIGGGSFASSTTNINFFFPEREKLSAAGSALLDDLGSLHRHVRLVHRVQPGLAAGTTLTIVASTARSLPLFICAVTALFAFSGLGNGSTYAMISRPYAAWAERAIAGGADATGARLDARRRAGAVIAFAGTVGALGGVGINLALRQSYLQAHTARPALVGFLVFYAVCVAVTVMAGSRSAVPAPAPESEVSGGVWSARRSRPAAAAERPAAAGQARRRG